MESIYNFINGETTATAKQLDVYEPAVGEVYAQAPASNANEVDLAVTAAAAAFDGWRRTPAAERARCLGRLADLLEERIDEFAAAESRDNGKPLQLAATLDIPRAVTNLRFFAGAAEHFASEAHAMEQGAINYTLRQPLGVVGCISPWNLPLYLFTWKVAPALAAGNTVVAKPSELTPMTAYLLSRLANRAGFPPGVFNVVHGEGANAGQAIVDNPRIKAISFTGGTVTGERIARSVAGSFKKLSLEMGGKNPTIVFADCDFDDMLATTVRAAFANQGEICLCGSRILIERPLYERFRDVFASAVSALRVGDPRNVDTDQGALVSKSHMNKVLGHIDQARKDGGTILAGGQRIRPEGRCRNGWFVAPTVIDGLGPACAANQEEIFGPVATLLPFEGEDEAIALANGSDYGLAASIWTADGSRALRLAQEVEAGLVWVNTWMMRDLRTPMGGMKRSGLGREGGFEAMRFFTEARNVCIRYE
ncbi:MAG: aldehyde dehydrogenase [Gammaproteobacteria bacterium]|nr:aldehyde dehydrogenase [Gammaproteobacteria bacterium]